MNAVHVVTADLHRVQITAVQSSSCTNYDVVAVGPSGDTTVPCIWLRDAADNTAKVRPPLYRPWFTHLQHQKRHCQRSDINIIKADLSTCAVSGACAMAAMLLCTCSRHIAWQAATGCWAAAACVCSQTCRSYPGLTASACRS